jgi:hypothetical protein
VNKDRQTTIQINGHTYNAITGELITAATEPNQLPSKKIVPHNNGISIDGVILNNSATNMVKDLTTQTTLSRQPPSKSSQVHKTTSKSQTLKRDIVELPKAALINNSQAGNSFSNAKQMLANTVSGQRQARSQGFVRSKSIAKFSNNPIPEDMPDPDPIKPPAPAPKPLSLKEQLIAQKLAEMAASEAVIKPEKISLASKFKTRFINNRTTSILATSVAAVLVVGYVTFLNIPRMTLRLASSRAGFEAQLPGYSPSGFGFSGPVAYAPGQVTIQYASNTDDRLYTIVEKQTTWDSETLLDNFVNQEAELPPSVYHERGLVVYIYDGTNATWVNGGIWYTIDGDSALTSEQLLKIAASL